MTLVKVPCCQEVLEVEFGEGAMLSGVRGGVW